MTAAPKKGETSERLAVLPAWRETFYFTEQEQAALSLSEYVTGIADSHANRPLYDEAVDLLTPQQVSAVTWMTVVIGPFGPEGGTPSTSNFSGPAINIIRRHHESAGQAPLSAVGGIIQAWHPYSASAPRGSSQARPSATSPSCRPARPPSTSAF